jgi:hypothetical protein
MIRSVAQAAAVYVLLSLLTMGHLFRHMADRSFAWFDGSILFYRMHWLGEVFWTGRGSVWRMPSILSPEGMPLLLTSNGLGREWFFAVLGRPLDPQIVGNLFALTVPFTVAMATFLCLRRLLRGGFLPALAGGWFAGMNSFFIEHFVHSWLCAFEPLVAFLVMLLLLLRGCTSRRILVTGFCAGATAWFCSQSIVYLVLIALVFAAWMLFKRKIVTAALLVPIGAIGGLIALPLLLQLWVAFDGDLAAMAGDSANHAIYLWRTKPLNWLAPPDSNSVLAPLRDPFGNLLPAPHQEAYLGWVVLPLAVLGIFSRRRGSGFLAALALLSLILSGGAVLSLGNEPTAEAPAFGPTWIPGPFLWMADWPIFHTLRTPARFVAVTHLALAVLGAFGVLRLLRWGPVRRFRVPVVAALLMLHSADRNLWSFEPFPRIESRFWSEVAAEPGGFAVLDLPYERGVDHYMHYGAYHRKGVIWGFGGRLPEARLQDRERDLRWALLGTGLPETWPTDHDRFARSLVRYRVRYLVLHEAHLKWNDQMRGTRAELIRLIEDPATWRDQPHIAPPRLAWQDQFLRVYRIEPARGAPAP